MTTNAKSLTASRAAERAAKRQAARAELIAAGKPADIFEEIAAVLGVKLAD